MKKTFLLASLISIMLIVGLVLIGCGGDKNSPSGVAKQFYAAAEKGDFKGMTALMDPQSAQFMAAMGEKIEGAVNSEGGVKESVNTKGGVVKTEETIDGDTAKVKLTFKDGSTEDLDLVKVDGKWKVTIKFK